MAIPELPDRLLTMSEAARHLGDSTSMTLLRQAISAYGTATHNSPLLTLARQQAQQRQHWNRLLADAVRAQDKTRPLLEAAARQWGSAAALRYTRLTSSRQTIADLNRLLDGMDAWQRLPEAQRTAAAGVLEDTYEHAGHSAGEEVSEELVAELEDTARTFVSSDAGILPPKVQRALFVYFCAGLVLIALMQASFTSDAADAVAEKFFTFGPAAALVAQAAGKAFDRYTGHQSDEDDESED